MKKPVGKIIPEKWGDADLDLKKISPKELKETRNKAYKYLIE